MSRPTTRFDVRDADYESRVRRSFDNQPMMRLLGAELLDVQPGEVRVGLPFREDLTQQHGYLHAAAVTAIADNACGYAAMTLLASGVEVLSVEFKINLLAPAAGERFVAVGRVLRPGRTLTACAAEVHAERDGESTLVAAMQATMISSRLKGERSE
jgi:uncharacterized protein (TIGR00369 family)